MARRISRSAAARRRESSTHRCGARPGRDDRLRARSLRLESLENRCLLAGDALVGMELVIVDSTGAPLTHVDVGDEFVLQGVVRDLRPDGTGVFAAYTDLTFDVGLASTTGRPVRSAAFSSGTAFESNTQGQISELGGFRSQSSPPDGLGTGAGAVFFSIPMIADAPGELLIATDPADLLPMSDVLLYGLDAFVAQDRIQYGYVRLQIGDPSGSPASPWRNPASPFDVNADGAIDALDVAQLQAEIDLRDGQTGPAESLAAKAPYFDVTGDRLITPDDVAAVLRQIPSARPAPQNPGDNPGSEEPGGDPGDEDRANGKERFFDLMEGWLDLDWQVELRVTNGLTLDPVTSARVGDIVYAYATLRVPEAANSAEIDKRLPLLSHYYLPAFTQTALAYDPTRLQLVDSHIEKMESRLRVYNLGPSPEPGALLNAMKRPTDKEWLVGASFVVLEPGSVQFSTLPEGAQPAAGLASLPSSLSDNVASRIDNSPELQQLGAQLNRLVQHATATVNLSTAGARPTAQADVYQLTDYRGDLKIDKDQGVLANDSAGASAQVLLVRQATHGNVTLNPDGSFRYGYGFERMRESSDSFAYVVINADGTSDFTEVEIRADHVPPIAEISVQIVDAKGKPLDSVFVGQQFFVQAVITDLRPDGVGPLSGARGATNAYVDLGYTSDTLQVSNSVSISGFFSGTERRQPWAVVNADEIRVRGISGTGPEPGALELFSVQVKAIAAGTAAINLDNVSLSLRPSFENIPARLIKFQSNTVDVQVDPGTLRLWSNPRNPLDVTNDGEVAPGDVLAIINSINSRGSRPLSGDLPEGEAYLDADADNFISPRDSLAVINHLNNRRRGEQPEGESKSPVTSAEGPSANSVEADLLTLLANDLLTENRRRR